MEDDEEDNLSDQETGSHGGQAGDQSTAFGAFLASFSPSGGLGSPTAFAASTASGAASAQGGSADGSKPFEILRDLLCHHAHLAVFMNYVISNSDPAALVSFRFRS